jgi:Flp pilus assembly protein CpaB
MEAGNLGKLGSRRAGQGLSSRRNSVLIAVVSAVLAGVLIYLFVSHSSKSTPAPVVLAPTEMTVFEARHTIPAGTPASTVVAGNLLKPVREPISQAYPGAITNPSVITGEVSQAAITTGQQVTAADFSRANVTIASYLTGDWRAIAVALDSWHGLTTYLHRGDTVDIMGQKGQNSEMLFEDITVLANSGGNVVLKMTDHQALVFDDDIGAGVQTWLTLRPTSGAKNSVHTGFVVKP